jgi:hypothetical protein
MLRAALAGRWERQQCAHQGGAALLGVARRGRRMGKRGSAKRRRPASAARPSPDRKVQERHGGVGSRSSVIDVQERVWSRSRSGAWAGRGFHYQDVVGAWLCAQVMTGELFADQVVPEGFEDLSCEGPRGRHFQVKSRQERVGDFAVRDVAAHIVKMIEAARQRDDDAHQLVLVLERVVKGCAIGGRGVIVGDLPVDDHLRVAVHDELRQRGHGPSAIDKVWAVSR